MSILRIDKDPETGFGVALQGEYGVGNGRGFAAIVTIASLSWLQQCGIVNYDERKSINDMYWRVDEKGIDYVSDQILKNTILSVMNNSPQRIEYNHVIWENTNTFYKNLGIDVIPSGQIPIDMLGDLGFEIYKRNWINV